jgi:hypothetical protein
MTLDNKGNVDVVNGLMVSGIYADIPLSAICVKTDKGRAAEIAIQLKTTKYEITPKDGLTIGWGENYNDDDTGTRNLQLVRSKKDTVNKNRQQSTYFGNLIFVEK